MPHAACIAGTTRLFVQVIAKDGEPSNPHISLNPLAVAPRGDAAAAVQDVPSPRSVGDEAPGSVVLKVRQDETVGGVAPARDVCVAGGVSVTVRQDDNDGFAPEGVPVFRKGAQGTGHDDDDEEDDDKYSEFGDEDRQDSIENEADIDRGSEAQKGTGEGEDETGASDHEGDAAEDGRWRKTEVDEGEEGHPDEDGQEEEAHKRSGGGVEKRSSNTPGDREVGMTQDVKKGVCTGRRARF